MLTYRREYEKKAFTAGEQTKFHLKNTVVFLDVPIGGLTFQSCL